MEKRTYHPKIFTLSSVLTDQECEGLIRYTEGQGYAAAPITTPFGPRYVPEVRDNTRVMQDELELAEQLFGRIRGALPATWRHGDLCGLNERFRFYRYEAGQAFRWHRDGAFVRNDRERSALTVMLYLNEGFEGGQTEFELPEGRVRIRPRAGTALVFDHYIRHQGAPVTQGRKYVARTDAMFREWGG